MRDDPTAIIGTAAVVATVTAMFAVLRYVVPLIQPYSTSAQLARTSRSFGLVGSAGIYRTISQLLWGRFRRWRWLRQFAFGPNFVESTWVGHYVRDGSAYHHEGVFMIKRPE